MSNSMLHDFGVNKTEHLKRSSWTVPIKHKTAFPQGVLIPLGWMDIIPGSTVSDDVSALTRLALTPYKPFMSDVYLTYGAYFVPYRVLFKNYQNMFGNGKPSEWSNPQEYVMAMGNLLYSGTQDPTAAGTGYDAVYNSCVNSGAGGIGAIVSKPGNLANYLGLPITDRNLSASSEMINIAPFLAYERIWTDYWRDENYQNPDPDLEKAYEFGSGSTSITNLRFCLHYANRFHDYLTSLLPNTQKGAAVQTVMPLHAFMDGNAPVFNALGGIAALSSNGTSVQNNKTLGTLSTNGAVAVGGTAPSSSVAITHTNLGTEISVTELRNAFALQRAAERNARGGSRMPEAMRTIFEANYPAVLDRAEFLGGNTIKLNLTSVPSTTDTPGKLGAFSATGSNTKSFVKTIDEPGIVMYVGVVRIKHVYQFAVEPYWKKSRRYDFYDPALAHISEVPAYQREYCGNLADGSASDVLGFRPAWVEYEKPIDKVTGYLALRESDTELACWVLQESIDIGDPYTPERYYLENGDEIAKCCIDFNTNYHSFQFIIDFEAAVKVTACKPLYSIPGFIDHLIA